LLFVSVALVAASADTIAYIANLATVGAVPENGLFPVSWRRLVGDWVGVLVISPLFLVLGSGSRLPRPSPIHLAQLLVLAAALAIIIWYREATTYQLFYLLFLPILWVGLRDGIVGSVLAINIVQIGILFSVHLRFGVTPGVGVLQTLMIVLALTALLVGVVVTERQAAGQRLRQQQSALERALRLRSAGETAAAIAHQLNQPLTAISTYASIAEDALGSGKDKLARDTMTKLTSECERAASVMRSIRDLVKQGALSREPMRLQSMVDSLKGIHAQDCTDNRIQLHSQIPAGYPQLFADPVQLEQALANLINNSIEAIKETGRGGRIDVSARLEKDDAVIEVSDNGPGFAPGLEATVTTPFMTTKQNGSGLGLAIARSVAEAHGGSLSVLPRSTGACVRLRIPATRRNHGLSDHYH
jgi:signal transduction histidine kinase